MDKKLKVKFHPLYRRIQGDGISTDALVSYGARLIQLSKDMDIYEVERVIVINLWLVHIIVSWTRLVDGQ